MCHVWCVVDWNELLYKTKRGESWYVSTMWPLECGVWYDGVVVEHNAFVKIIFQQPPVQRVTQEVYGLLVAGTANALRNVDRNRAGFEDLDDEEKDLAQYAKNALAQLTQHGYASDLRSASSSSRTAFPTPSKTYRHRRGATRPLGCARWSRRG
jgi:hypothetical protein